MADTSGSGKYDSYNKAYALGLVPHSSAAGSREPKRQTAAQLAADIARVGF